MQSTYIGIIPRPSPPSKEQCKELAMALEGNKIVCDDKAQASRNNLTRLLLLTIHNSKILHNFSTIVFFSLRYLMYTPNSSQCCGAEFGKEIKGVVP